ncbi:N-acetylmuramoyl-L-alanine amidase family protein [Clostridium sp.]|uniref:N-acetylmuramoyl-L-alanine amidase family protein n=1 Tax=Clostridium sp. TaxID=1506 RepID=UPI00284E18E8|nr:N-acetylmuramoyl-L-alanine amidase family protein [Clostridium sp.]MDR3596966.1 N-acetylmuramoyl-L-alanine amidase family protein [Clostridium sp.]
MIKRLSKATSVLVAAAAVISLMPSLGVSAATQQLTTKEGTIDTAIAYANGNFVYEGYKNQNDTTGFYYSSGNQDKLVEDVNVDSMNKFGDKYAKIESGTDEYLVDLSNGTVQDGTTQDISDSVKIKLKSTLSKTDRYGVINSTDNITSLDEITQNQFGEDWYSYTAAGKTATHSGYVSDSGKYIDADYTANMYVVNGNKTVEISEFGQKDSNTGIEVDLVSSTTIAQDADYIYRLAKVNIINGATTSQATYIQKISKAQGTQQDGAYLPSSVTSYEVSSAYNSDNADTAATAINAATDFRVINGVVYATENDGSKVTVTTIDLKRDKVALDSDSTKTKLDVYLAEKDVQESQDITAKTGVSIDVDGNTWAINDGAIYKFDGSNFTQVYSADSGLDSLDVYNADSLIAWSDSKNIYATIDNQTSTAATVTTGATSTNAGTTSTAAGTATATTNTATAAGWVKNADGTWSYNKADGTKATGWIQDGAWYYLNANGIMQTGWVNDNGTWYFLKSSGAMATGWIQDGGAWYCLNASGAMLANTTTPDGYFVGANGAWVK